MAEHFEYFLSKGFAPAIECWPVSEKTLKRYKGKLPDKLLEYWQSFGFCGYGEGLFWIVNPEDYEDVVDVWLEDTGLDKIDKYHLIARSAFGMMYLWGEKSGRTLDILPMYGMLLPTPPEGEGLFDLDIQVLISGRTKDELDFTDVNDKKLFKKALKKLGRLAPDEMYGFEPALALGGQEKLENLVKVKAVEHLIILAQLGEKVIRENEAIKLLREGKIKP
jgi:hypothetical protein